MKQIFDWLREQMRTHSNEAEASMFYMIDEGRGERCVYSEIDFEEQKSKTWIDAISLVDEAEAKWEADCCEWKQEKCLEFSLSDCVTSCGHAEHYSTGIDKYCRHCGKPIKISEVE